MPNVSLTSRLLLYQLMEVEVIYMPEPSYPIKLARATSILIKGNESYDSGKRDIAH